MKHGTKRAYGLHGCRCEECKRANTDACKAWRRRRGDRPIEEVNAERAAAVKHGTCTKYRRHKCRCEICREWARADRAKYRARAKAGAR